MELSKLYHWLEKKVKTDHRTKLAKVYGSQYGGSIDLGSY